MPSELPADWHSLADSGALAAKSAALQAVLGAYIAELNDLRDIAAGLTADIADIRESNRGKPAKDRDPISGLVGLRMTTSLKLNQTADRIVELATVIASHPTGAESYSFAPREVVRSGPDEAEMDDPASQPASGVAPPILHS